MNIEKHSDETIDDLTQKLLGGYDTKCENTHCYYIEDDVYKAMAAMFKAAQQIGGEDDAVQFAEWLQSSDYAFYEGSYYNYIEVGPIEEHKRMKYTTDDLYKIFLTTIKKKAQ